MKEPIKHPTALSRDELWGEETYYRPPKEAVKFWNRWIYKQWVYNDQGCRLEAMLRENTPDESEEGLVFGHRLSNGEKTHFFTLKDIKNIYSQLKSKRRDDGGRQV